MPFFSDPVSRPARAHRILRGLIHATPQQDRQTPNAVNRINRAIHTRLMRFVPHRILRGLVRPLRQALPCYSLAESGIQAGKDDSARRLNSVENAGATANSRTVLLKTLGSLSKYLGCGAYSCTGRWYRILVFLLTT